MRRRRILDPSEVNAINNFNSQMDAAIGAPSNYVENNKTNAYISMNPIVSQDPNELNLEIGTETGIHDFNFMDDNFIDDELYVDTGELIPRDIVEEAERQFAFHKH